MTERSRDERIEDYYHQSAWDLAESLVDLEDENERLKAKVEERDGLLERGHELYLMFRRLREEEFDRAERNRLAWLSARRRAADEANMGMEALELKEAELQRLTANRDAWRRGLETAEAQLVRERRENARLRAFAADVIAVRGWAFDGSSECPMRFLREIYGSTYELEAAEREGRTYRDRWTRNGHEALYDQCPQCDTIPTSVPQPAPCTCGDEAATVTYWKAELERAHQDEVRQSTSGAPRLECVGSDGDGGTVWRLAEGD